MQKIFDLLRSSSSWGRFSGHCITSPGGVGLASGCEAFDPGQDVEDRFVEVRSPAVSLLGRKCAWGGRFEKHSLIS